MYLKRLPVFQGEVGVMYLVSKSSLWCWFPVLYVVIDHFLTFFYAGSAIDRFAADLFGHVLPGQFQINQAGGKLIKKIPDFTFSQSPATARIHDSEDNRGF